MKLNDEITEEICKYLSVGLYVTTVCDLVGIVPSTFYAWQNKGEDEIERREKGHKADPKAQPYLDFCMAVRAACAQSEFVAVAAFRGGFSKSDGWKAAEKFLGRRYPGRWGNRQHVHHSGKIEHGSELAKAVEAQGPEAAQQLVSAYMKALEGDE